MEKNNILIGVCAGISSYKTASLVGALSKDNFSVKVMMTQNAAKFVTPIVFQTLSHNVVYTDMFALYNSESLSHISLANWANLCVIAPLSANTLAKLAYGLCDNLLTTVVCALKQTAKVLCVPAMNENMWQNPVTRENVTKLKNQRKFVFLDPVKGQLASGAYGEGRMPEPKNILAKVKTIIREEN